LIVGGGSLKRGGIRFRGGTEGLVIRHMTLLDGADISLGDVAVNPLIEENTFYGSAAGRGGIGGRDLYDGVIRHNRLMNASGIQLNYSEDLLVTDNILLDTDAGIGFFKSHGEIARNRVVGTSGYCAVGIGPGTGSVHDNLITHNEGCGVLPAARVSVSHNVITNNAGNGVDGGSEGAYATLDGNIIAGNGGHGVILQGRYGYQPSIDITNNLIVGNALDGVHVGDETREAEISGNRIDRNGDDGIDVENPDATVTGNHTWWNGDLGIEAVPTTLGGGNWAKHNGNSRQCVPRSLCSATGKPKK
jgi:hypothetical protein